MIKLAFNRLYNQGFICRTAFRGNEVEAAQAITKRALERKSEGAPVNGGVFFTAADVANRTPDGAYPIHFGRPATDKTGPMGLPEQVIAQKICEAIKASNGWCEWDGNPEHPVIVKDN
jgi:hypothetical protein